MIFYKAWFKSRYPFPCFYLKVRKKKKTKLLCVQRSEDPRKLPRGMKALKKDSSAIEKCFCAESPEHISMYTAFNKDCTLTLMQVFE